MPQLVEQHGEEHGVDADIVVLSAILPVELCVSFYDSGRFWQSVGLGLLIVALWAAAYAWQQRREPSKLGWPVLAVFVLAPSLGPLVVTDAPGRATFLLVANVVIAAGTLAISSYGLIAVTRWAARHVRRELRELVGLLTRALPLLLLFVTFLFVNTEVWQVAESLEWEFLLGTVLLFALLGTGFLLTSLPTEVGGWARFDDDDEVDRLCADTPAEPAAQAIGELESVPTELAQRQRANVYLVVVISEAIQVVLVAITIFVFFVAFGLVAIRPDVVTSWVGEQALDEAVLDVTIAGHDVVLTAALLRVAVFLAAFSGFYFAVYTVTDDRYRKEFFERIATEMRQTFAVRAAYLALLRRPSG
jgi:hypothetical protein